MSCEFNVVVFHGVVDQDWVGRSDHRYEGICRVWQIGTNTPTCNPPMVPQATSVLMFLFFTLYTFRTGCSTGRSARVRSSKLLWPDRQHSNAAERAGWACAVVHTIRAFTFHVVVFRCSANVAKVMSAEFPIIQMHQNYLSWCLLVRCRGCFGSALAFQVPSGCFGPYVRFDTAQHFAIGHVLC